MFGFLIGWGVFWLLCWVLAFALGALARMDELLGMGVIGAILSVIFLIAVFVGRLFAGI